MAAVQLHLSLEKDLESSPKYFFTLSKSGSLEHFEHPTQTKSSDLFLLVSAIKGKALFMTALRDSSESGRGVHMMSSQ